MPRRTHIGQPKHRSLTLAESQHQAREIVAAHGISLPSIEPSSTPAVLNSNTRRRRRRRRRRGEHAALATLAPLAPLASNPKTLHYASTAMMNTKTPLPSIPKGKKGGRSRRVSKHIHRKTFRR